MPAEVVRIEVTGLEELASRLRGGREAMGIVVNEGLREIGSRLVPILKGHTPIGATRRLRNSTVFEVLTTGDPGDQKVEVRQGARSKLSGFAYGVVVREGRRPGKAPPPGALDDWVRVKLGVPLKMIKSVAFLIGRKIARFGTKPNPYHLAALEEGRPIIGSEATRMGDRMAAFVAGKGV